MSCFVYRDLTIASSEDDVPPLPNSNVVLQQQSAKQYNNQYRSLSDGAHLYTLPKQCFLFSYQQYRSNQAMIVQQQKQQQQR
ncbi:hypothetical protein DPMN_131369 [Dreissena polymorpha]|uniref:Uncharacterized protein n=1 Tax=Dreissena polymorpha TaxID=45954 RepID=A0A9D4H6A6_DREPO|nr:hypothetical protein DPMN_131369 [Dreissena polymorpha]